MRYLNMSVLIDAAFYVAGVVTSAGAIKLYEKLATKAEAVAADATTDVKSAVTTVEADAKKL
jgi:hypothetical protein